MHVGTGTQKPLGERVRALRTRAGLSQEGLARKADVSMATIHRIEQPQVGASLETLRKLAAALDVPVSELVD